MAPIHCQSIQWWANVCCSNAKFLQISYDEETESDVKSA